MAAYQAKKTRKPAQVLADIAAGRIEPVYVLFGDDTAMAEEIIEALRARLIEPGFGTMNFSNLHPPKLNEAGASAWPTELLQLVNTPPMGAARRLVVIRGFDVLDKQRAEAVGSGLAKTPDFTTVVATCEYDRTRERLFNQTGLARFVVDLRSPSADDRIAMLRRWAKERGIELDVKAAALLVEIAGTDTALLKTEIEKLATLLGKGGRATVEVVQELAADSREYSLREYTMATLGRNLKPALTELRRLQDWGEEPIRIVGWLAPALIRLASEARGDAARLFNRALHRLYEINREIVSGGAEPFLLLELFTVCLACSGRTCRLAGQPNAPNFCLHRLPPARRKAVNE